MAKYDENKCITYVDPFAMGEEDDGVCGADAVFNSTFRRRSDGYEVTQATCPEHEKFCNEQWDWVKSERRA